MQRQMQQENIKNILIINLGGIGDIIMSVPALKALRSFYRNARITVWVVPKAKEVLEGLDYFDKLITMDLSVEERRGVKIFFNLKKMRGLFLFISLLRAEKFDMIINMRPLISIISALKMAAIFYAIGAKYRVGRDTAGMGFFLTHKVYEEYISRTHEVEHQLGVARILGAKPGAYGFEIKIPRGEEIFIENFLSANGIEDTDTVIGINPGAPWPSKRWPIENFTKAIAGLLKEFKCKIIITGSADEIVLADKLKELTGKGVIIAAGKTNLKQLAALIKRFDLFITNDTGPMHLAAVFNIPQVVIFKPGHTERNKPYTDKEKFVILSKNVKCGPCQRVRCKLLSCLKQITTEDVLNASRMLLEKFKNRRRDYV